MGVLATKLRQRGSKTHPHGISPGSRLQQACSGGPTYTVDQFLRRADAWRQYDRRMFSELSKADGRYYELTGTLRGTLNEFIGHGNGEYEIIANPLLLSTCASEGKARLGNR